MATQIRPNRLEVSDRFPMLGFTVRTDGTPKRFEIAIATSPELFGPDAKGQRNRHTFYSTRVIGPLPIERGEAVYVLPSEVLARFVGQQKLYYGLATFSNGASSAEVVSTPKPGSPYINIANLTGRSLQRVRVLPNRQRAASGYGKNGIELEWAGDAAMPGTQPTTPSAAKAPDAKNAAPGHDAASVHYDDGYGPLPPSPASTTPSQPQPQTKSLADNGDRYATHGIDGPVPHDAAAQGLARSMGIDPEYPQASRFEPAASVNFRAVSGTRTVNCIVIHITDGGSKINGTIGWFQNPNQRNLKGDPIHVSAHYVVGQDGEVVQMVRNNDVAWHASAVNGSSIGIEHVARAPHAWDTVKGVPHPDPGLMPTDAQFCASAALVNWLCSQFNIPMDRDHILGHNEASPRDKHTDCPNAVWDWDYYMGLVTSSTCYPKTAAASSLAQSASRGVRPKPKAAGLAQVDPGYTPTNTQDALQYMKQFQDRKQAWAAGVTDTSFFPHSAICRFRIFQPDGEYIGTGFYIGQDRILTCAHNVANATSVTVIPGKNDAAEPFGSFTVQSSDWTVHPKYDAAVRDFDLAVIKVNTPPPYGQAFSILEELLECQESPIIVCGYAAAHVSPNKQHLDGDAIRLLNDTGEVFLYNLQTEPGNSGSPVYYVTARDDEALQQCVLETRLVGVHVASVVGSKILNEGCRLTADKIAWINSVGKPFSAGAAFSFGTDDGSPHHHKHKHHHHHAEAHALDDGDTFTFSMQCGESIGDRVVRCCREALAGGKMGENDRHDFYRSFISAGQEKSDAGAEALTHVRTSCAMFVRAVRIFCGATAPGPYQPGTGMFVSMGNVSFGHPAFVALSSGATPNPGDYFYISSAKDSNDGHTGIFLSQSDDGSWETAEGGGGDGTVCQIGHRRIAANRFDNDGRTLWGWFDCTKVGLPQSDACQHADTQDPANAQSLADDDDDSLHGIDGPMPYDAASALSLAEKKRRQTASAYGVGTASSRTMDAPATQPASTTSGIGVADDSRSFLACIQGLTEQGRGISFVQRYLRNLTIPEATALSNARLPIVSCYEENQSDPPVTFFTQAQGQHDGRRAFTQARALGQPAGTPIYFAIDTDPDIRQRGIILDYVQGIREGCAQYLADMQAQGLDAPLYDVGIYGSGCVLEWCRDQGIANWFWQARAPGWCNNRQPWPGANLRTWRLDSPATCGSSLDHLEGWGNEGGWTVTAAAAGQSQALSVKLPPAPPRRRYASGQAADAPARTVAGSPVTTIKGSNGNISWELDQFPGVKTLAQAAAAPLQSAETIKLSNWPYCDHTDGSRSCAWFAVDWQFSGQSLGQVRITPAGAQQGAQPLRVEACIADGKDDKQAGVTSLALLFTYHFSTSDGPEVAAKTELTLYSDGSIDQKSNWMARAAA